MAANYRCDGIKNHGMLFINDEGQSLHFVIGMKNIHERDELKKTIEYHLGCVSTELNDIGPYSAVLVDNVTWSAENLEKFHVGYAYDCLKKGEILDITGYLVLPSKIYRTNFDYMDIIYYKKYSWRNVPDRYVLQSDEDSESDVGNQDSSSIMPFSFDDHIRTKHLNKHSRLPYNKKEKEAIIRYIITYNAFGDVAGNKIWKDMEYKKICPNRTWQSMKEHFRRTIMREINSFSSLTPKEKKKFNSIRRS